MCKIFKFLAFLILMPAALLGAAGVCQAASIPAGFEVWDSRTTDDILKSWTIKFNKPAEQTTVNGTNIFVTDADNRPLATILSVSGDGASVAVRPASPYTVGNEYRLYVTKGVCARGAGGQKGAPLSKQLALPFTIAFQGGYIQSVSSVYHTLLTSITVITSKDVHSVSIDDTDMQYLGGNKFKLGIPGLAPGATVVIRAYDGSGEQLLVQDYIIK